MTGKRIYSPLANCKKLANQQMMRKRPYVIGICGGPSSGKSTVAKIIKEQLPQAIILNLINFYKPIRGNMRRSRANSMVDDQRDEKEIKEEIREVYRRIDFDSPDAIDWDLLNKGVQSLKNYKPFNKPIYNQDEMIRLAETDHIKPSPVIIIEGHLIFSNEELIKKMDLKVFLDTDDDVRLSRSVLKNSRRHPGDMQFLKDFLQKYEQSVKPNFEKYIEPTKKYADIILPNYGFTTEDALDIYKMNIPAIDLIINRVLSEQ
uniref:Phosphoribulokinase/uridine kinase domain-containing protein n=1 Tax=Strombidium rassoulzadegani TaxID=1082188 RepID=A0A7S3CSX4_9SPIT|mmetsp:Transcript_7463/g.12616  ORF Transcript_7463/g.12616 Transcript_7463/m.12616 type:complete len:261 (+) Transcript_7463:204-986(+)